MHSCTSKNEPGLFRTGPKLHGGGRHRPVCQGHLVGRSRASGDLAEELKPGFVQVLDSYLPVGRVHDALRNFWFRHASALAVSPYRLVCCVDPPGKFSRAGAGLFKPLGKSHAAVQPYWLIEVNHLGCSPRHQIG